MVVSSLPPWLRYVKGGREDGTTALRTSVMGIPLTTTSSTLSFATMIDMDLTVNTSLLVYYIRLADYNPDHVALFAAGGAWSMYSSKDLG